MTISTDKVVLQESNRGHLGHILGIRVNVKIVLGSTWLPVSELVKLKRGEIITLDQRIGDAVSIVVNGHIIARGEIVVIDEATSRLGVSLSEVVSDPGADAVELGS